MNACKVTLIPFWPQIRWIVEYGFAFSIGRLYLLYHVNYSIIFVTSGFYTFFVWFHMNQWNLQLNWLEKINGIILNSRIKIRKLSICLYIDMLLSLFFLLRTFFRKRKFNYKNERLDDLIGHQHHCFNIDVFATT